MAMINWFLVRILRWLDVRLVDLYSAPESTAWRWLLWPVYTLRRMALLLQSGIFFDVYLMEGQAAGSTQRLRVGYLCAGRGMEYLVRRLFEGSPDRVDKRGRVPFWRQAAAAQALAAQADLVVVERNNLLRWHPITGEWVAAPTWVRMVVELDLHKSWQENEQAFKKHERNIRRFRRAGYTYRISRDIQDFDFFYDRMYVPLVTKRHNEEAFVDSRAHLLSYFQRGFLLVIYDRDGQPVAADLDYTNGDMLFGIACGVLDGRDDILEEGALSAIYYYVLQWAHENRVQRCDICEVRPFVQDGVYQYKRRWGYQPVEELWNTREWLLWAPNRDPLVQEWIRNHPFLPEFTRTSAARPSGNFKTTGI
jgi:hypothetical protein